MNRWPRVTIGRSMIAIAALAVLLGGWRVAPAIPIILVSYGLLFLPLLQSTPHGKS